MNQGNKWKKKKKQENSSNSDASLKLKSTFLNGLISEELMFVKQPPEFDDLKHSKFIFKLKK